ncbi:hypothetical protein ACJIZ3_013356 [Penstemon smallii]|uniref:Uncharacterized protein n=1 Tax=Penstemon smallii TaxID=265156 RepID=A0ABD3UPP1_9LAMI
MSCINIVGCQFSCSPSAFAVRAFQLNKESIYLGTKLHKIPRKLTYATSRYQQTAPVCLFGGKDKSENGNEGSPWKALEKVMGNFKKSPSVEDLLKQQIQKQEYYDGGDGGGDGGGGGGAGGGDGFGEAEDESLSGKWDEFVQVFLATLGFVFLYIYIIEGEEITVLAKDLTKFLFKRQMSIRLRRLMSQWKRFFQRMREEEYYDPYWLEREILYTPTWYDSPAKYRYIIKNFLNSEDEDDD